jgi:hypothetical protein
MFLPTVVVAKQREENALIWKSFLQQYQLVSWQSRMGYEVNNRIRANMRFLLGWRKASFQS